MPRLKELTVIILFTSFLILTATAAAEDRERRSELLLGAAPFMSPDTLFKRLSPLRDYLSKELDQEVAIELAQTIDHLVKRTDAGHYDMIFTAPHLALRAIESGLYVPGVIPVDLTKVVLIVSSSSPVDSIGQLKGKVVSAPQKNGALWFIAPKFFMLNKYSRDELPKFINYGSHNAAFMAAQNGDVDAAFVAEIGYINLQAENAVDHVKVIAQTEPFPGLSMIISEHLSSEMRELIITSMLELGKSADGKAILNKIAFPPFRRYSIEEFDSIRHYFDESKFIDNTNPQSNNRGQ